ncbi:MAG TPA: GntR family transcriptional regulator [Solirubrobacteraceae bacterium]
MSASVSGSGLGEVRERSRHHRQDDRVSEASAVAQACCTFRDVSDNSVKGRSRRASLEGLGSGIRRHSTAEQVAAILRTAILDGQLLPGDPLREVPLAEELGVSRNSIREAVRILEGQYLVRYAMNRGTVVAEFSDAEIDDLFAAREVLELAGLRALHAAGPKDRAAYLQPFVRAIEDADRAGDLAAAAAADEAFHVAIVARTENEHLMRWYGGLRHELRLALVLAERHRADLGRTDTQASRARNDHRKLTRALLRNEESGARALSAHLRYGAAELHLLREMLGQTSRQQDSAG